MLARLPSSLISLDYLKKKKNSFCSLLQLPFRSWSFRASSPIPYLSIIHSINLLSFHLLPSHGSPSPRAWLFHRAPSSKSVKPGSLLIPPIHCILRPAVHSSSPFHLPSCWTGSLSSYAFSLRTSDHHWWSCFFIPPTSRSPDPATSCNLSDSSLLLTSQCYPALIHMPR